MTHSNEISPGCDGTEHPLFLGEVQPTDVPVDPHSTSDFFIS